MALIRCRECDREVSDQAAACPACGAPVALHVAPPPPVEKNGCGRAALWIVAIVIGGPIVLFFGSAFIAGTIEAFSDGDSPGRDSYTGKLRIDAGTEYELLEEPSQIGGACTGWNVMSIQKTGDRASGMRDLICWRRDGDRIETNSRDGSGRRSDPRAVYVD